jgi:hypothetical protein
MHEMNISEMFSVRKGIQITQSMLYIGNDRLLIRVSSDDASKMPFYTCDIELTSCVKLNIPTTSDFLLYADQNEMILARNRADNPIMLRYTLK